MTTEVQGSNGCSALVYGYGGTLTAYSVALNLIGGPERLVYLLPVGIFSLVAVMFSFGFLQGALKDLRHRSWPKVTGTVLKGGPRNSPLQVVYLVAGGHEQRSTVEIDSTDRWISDGRPVRLRYDPENPAVAHSPSGTVSKVFSFVVAAGTTTATVVYAAEGLITDFGS
ncbi:DUF3592 domain-containing protein [Streptomyces sp. NPDC058877]|uniref:DUF3592 domain-containing protein n=1 Tax=unclassified Streptomyces TaxID=2593676 RepID=UPI0036BD72DD